MIELGRAQMTGAVPIEGPAGLDVVRRPALDAKQRPVVDASIVGRR